MARGFFSYYFHRLFRAVTATAASAKSMKIESQALTIYHSVQCPYTWQSIEMVRKYCAENHVPVRFCPVDSLAKAKQLPCVFNNWAVFYRGSFQTVNLLDAASLKRILKSIRLICFIPFFCVHRLIPMNIRIFCDQLSGL